MFAAPCRRRSCYNHPSNLRITRFRRRQGKSIVMADNSDPHASAPFDRAALLRHRNRAANAWAEYYHIHSDRGEASGEASGAPDFLLREVAGRLADRLLDINRSFERGLDLGCHGGQLGAVLEDKVNWLAQADASEAMARQARAFGPVLVADEEALPIAPQSLDLVLSCLSLHWVNDLPGRPAAGAPGPEAGRSVPGGADRRRQSARIAAIPAAGGNHGLGWCPAPHCPDARYPRRRRSLAAGRFRPAGGRRRRALFSLWRPLYPAQGAAPAPVSRARSRRGRGISPAAAYSPKWPTPYHQDWAGSDGRLPATFPDPLPHRLGPGRQSTAPAGAGPAPATVSPTPSIRRRQMVKRIRPGCGRSGHR